jgi:twitching motility protein PilT
VRNLVRENNLHQLETVMQMGARDGMVLMDSCLESLYGRCDITYDTALARARHPQNFAQRRG